VDATVCAIADMTAALPVDVATHAFGAVTVHDFPPLLDPDSKSRLLVD
jgi:hypothetical protein